MTLFIGLWHLVGVLGVSLACAAFVGVSALLWFLWDIWQQIEDEKSGAEQRKRDRKSQSAVKGWQTRRSRSADDPYRIGSERLDDEAERVLRAIDEQDRAKAITPDDALKFVQRGEDQ